MPPTRRDFLKTTAAGAVLAATRSLAAPRPVPRPRNVLLLMVDDLNVALSPWGHPAAITPNIARLASRGLRFSRAYCPYPLCGPSRSAFLTGRRPEWLGMGTNEVDWRSGHPDVVTLPEIARAHGLHARRIGKITHQGLPEGSEARKEVLARKSLPHTHYDPIAWEVEFGDTPYSYERHAQGRERVLSGHPHGGISLHTMRVDTPDVLPDHLFADHAVDFLASAAAHDPFFLGVGFMKPHVPLFAPEACWKPFDALDVASLFSPSAWKPPANLSPGALLHPSFHRGLDLEAREHLYRGYMASVMWTDSQLGRVLDALEASGEADRTLIVFVADHGYHLGEQGAWDKMMLFEPSLHIPLIIAGAGVTAPGGTCDALVESLDLFPTICGLMDWKAPESHGTDLTPWLRDPARPSNRPVHAWVHAGRRQGWSIRTDTHRYSITSLDDQYGAMLFDLTNDPAEMDNLSGHPEHAELEKSLRDRLFAQYPDCPQRGTTADS